MTQSVHTRGILRFMARNLSYTEISTALTCWAQHDFSYGGRLAGATLKPRHTMPILSGGRAWGAAVAAYHAGGSTLLATFDAMAALRKSLDDDYAKMVEHGALLAGVLLDQRVAMEEHLGKVFEHYTEQAPPLANLTRLEDRILVPIPSRGGIRASSRYRFECYLDGFEVDEHGHEWLVEFKYRNELTRPALLRRQRQLRWYAWARQRETGSQVVGIKIDERLSEFPKPPKIVQATKKVDRLFQAEDGKWYTVSHDSKQVTTPELYRQACERYGVQPQPETLEALSVRRWQQRVPIPFRPSELREAGDELVSAAKLIRDLDSGDKYPIRNAQARLCNGCRFRGICDEPGDTAIVDQSFIRTVPKRLRPPVSNGDHVQAVEATDSPNQVATAIPSITQEVPF